jgi:hypothetical protein
VEAVAERDDPVERARRAGTVPAAPGFTGWAVAVGGTLGAVGGAWSVPWQRLGALSFGGDAASLATGLGAVRGALIGGLAAPVLGALAGLVAAQVVLGAAGAFGARRRAQRLAPPRRLGMLAALGGVAAALALPAALAGDGDAGGLLLRAPLLGAALAALGTLPAALVDRARGRAAYAAHLDGDADHRPSGSAAQAVTRAARAEARSAPGRPTRTLSDPGPAPPPPPRRPAP